MKQIRKNILVYTKKNQSQHENVGIFFLNTITIVALIRVILSKL